MRYRSIDVETIEGYCRLISDKNNYVLIDNVNDAISFLFKRQKPLTCFNMTYDMLSILKYLPKDNLWELGKEHETEYENYKIVYYPGKLTSFRKDSNSRVVYDIAQFYPGESLDSASKKYLEKEKLSSPVIENFKKKQRTWHPEILELYLEKNLEEIAKYSMYDSFLTEQLTDVLCKSCKTNLGFYPYRLTSNAGFGVHLTNKATYPKLDGEWEKWGKFAYRGGIFEVYQRGTFYDCVDLDINSAYPEITKDLPNWLDGHFFIIRDEKDILEDDVYGWIYCTFDCPCIPYYQNIKEIHEAFMSNKTYKIKSNVKKIYYPLGEREQIVTLSEYRFMKQWGFKLEVLRGYVWRPEPNIEIRKPFGWIDEIYKKKMKLKREGKTKTMDYVLCKIAMNGVYGKTVQKQGNSPLLDFCYGSTITAMTRIKVFDLIFKHNLHNKVISIATDGLLLEGDIDIEVGEDIGMWEKQSWDEVVFITNGMYSLISKDRINTRLRGITEKRDINLKAILQKHRKDNEIFPYISLRPITLMESLIFLEYSPKDINVFARKSRKIRLDNAYQRKWQDILNFGNLLDSNFVGERWDISELEIGDTEQKLEKYRKTHKLKPWFREIDEDKIDYIAYHDSSLTKEENIKILKDLWKR